jgi:hypothetical protein
MSSGKDRSRAPYSVRLEPERDVLARKRALLADIISSKMDRAVRMGEQFFLGCRCGEVRVTSSAGAVTRFQARHATCRDGTLIRVEDEQPETS